MNKDALAEAVQAKAGLETKKAAVDAVEAVFETITESLSRKEEVAVAGFGSFKAADRAARAGVNPKTGEKIQIAATTVAKFKAGKALKEAVK